MAHCDVGGGCTLFFEERGAGEPLLFLHGFTGIGGDSRYIFSTDPEGFRLIAPDLRGHGRSTNESHVFTFRRSAEDMFALMDHLRLPTVKALGVSAGAKTLLHMATMEPDRVSAMVIVSGAPYFPAQARAAMSRLSTDTLSETDWATLRSRHVLGDEQIRALYEQGRGFATSYSDMAFTPPLLGTITARTLIVHGDRDELYPVELAVELYRSIPNSALWVVPNGGHGAVFGPLAARFAETAAAFLKG